jgi:[ribosomal protein S5]-alanine N-acetyltransferase
MTFSLQTRRLHIRPWLESDRPALGRMAQDAEMMRYITRGRTWSDEEVDEILHRQARHLEQYGICFGAVVLSATGEVIGMAGLQPHDDGQFELGWWIWKEYWSRGYATEAAVAIVEHARNAMGLKRLVAVIDPPNLASTRVAEKLGMRFECIKSARETIAKREDMPIAYFAMTLDEANSVELQGGHGQRRPADDESHATDRRDGAEAAHPGEDHGVQ